MQIADELLSSVARCAFSHDVASAISSLDIRGAEALLSQLDKRIGLSQHRKLQRQQQHHHAHLHSAQAAPLSPNLAVSSASAVPGVSAASAARTASPTPTGSANVGAGKAPSTPLHPHAQGRYLQASPAPSPPSASPRAPSRVLSGANSPASPSSSRSVTSDSPRSPRSPQQQSSMHARRTSSSTSTPSSSSSSSSNTLTVRSQPAMPAMTSPLTPLASATTPLASSSTPVLDIPRTEVLFRYLLHFLEILGADKLARWNVLCQLGFESAETESTRALTAYVFHWMNNSNTIPAFLFDVFLGQRPKNPVIKLLRRASVLHPIQFFTQVTSMLQDRSADVRFKGIELLMHVVERPSPSKSLRAFMLRTSGERRLTCYAALLSHLVKTRNEHHLSTGLLALVMALPALVGVVNAASPTSADSLSTDAARILAKQRLFEICTRAILWDARKKPKSAKSARTRLQLRQPSTASDVSVESDIATAQEQVDELLTRHKRSDSNASSESGHSSASTASYPATVGESNIADDSIRQSPSITRSNSFSIGITSRDGVTTPAALAQLGAPQLSLSRTPGTPASRKSYKLGRSASLSPRAATKVTAVEALRRAHPNALDDTSPRSSIASPAPSLHSLPWVQTELSELDSASHMFFRRLYELFPWDLIHYLRSECTSRASREPKTDEPNLATELQSYLHDLPLHPSLIHEDIEATGLVTSAIGLTTTHSPTSSTVSSGSDFHTPTKTPLFVAAHAIADLPETEPLGAPHSVMSLPMPVVDESPPPTRMAMFSSTTASGRVPASIEAKPAFISDLLGKAANVEPAQQLDAVKAFEAMHDNLCAMAARFGVAVPYTSWNAYGLVAGAHELPGDVVSLQARVLVMQNELFLERHLRKEQEARLQRLQRQVESRKTRHSRSESLQAEVEQLRRVVAKQRTEFATLATKNKQWEVKTFRELERVKEHRDQLSQNAVMLQEQLQSEVEEKNAVRTHAEELRSELRRAQLDIEHYEGVQTTLAQFEQANDDLREQLVGWKSRFNHFVNGTLHGELHRRDVMREGLTNQLLAADSQMARVRDEVDTMRMRYEAAERAREEDKAQIEQLKAMLETQGQVSAAQMEAVNRKYLTIKAINASLTQLVSELRRTTDPKSSPPTMKPPEPASEEELHDPSSLLGPQQNQQANVLGRLTSYVFPWGSQQPMADPPVLADDEANPAARGSQRQAFIHEDYYS